MYYPWHNYYIHTFRILQHMNHLILSRTYNILNQPLLYIYFNLYKNIFIMCNIIHNKINFFNISYYYYLLILFNSTFLIIKTPIILSPLIALVIIRLFSKFSIAYKFLYKAYDVTTLKSLFKNSIKISSFIIFSILALTFLSFLSLTL